MSFRDAVGLLSTIDLRHRLLQLDPRWFTPAAVHALLLLVSQATAENATDCVPEVTTLCHWLTAVADLIRFYYSHMYVLCCW